MKTMTVKEVAARLNVTPVTITRWIAKGHFPSAYKLDPTASNSAYRIPESDVIAFESLRAAATA